MQGELETKTSSIAKRQKFAKDEWVSIIPGLTEIVSFNVGWYCFERDEKLI